MYLAPHVRTLYTQIRNRALIQVDVGGTDSRWGASQGAGGHGKLTRPLPAVLQPLRVC